MGITPVGLSQHINGNPSVEVLERIAAAIGCNVGDFSPLNRRTRSPARIAANLSKWRRENSNGDAGALHIFLSGVTR